jgi:hypothetical protein
LLASVSQINERFGLMLQAQGIPSSETLKPLRPESWVADVLEERQMVKPYYDPLARLANVEL